MIASLQGVLDYKDSTSAVINVGGVGYVCFMSTTSLLALGKVGSNVRVDTLMQIKNEAVALYGFASNDERALFESLISVSGVGAKFALAILSTYTPSELTKILQSGDDKRLTAVSGIGKKTAQRIILELQGTLDMLKDNSGNDSELGSAQAEAHMALEAMGFSASEIALALEQDEQSQDATEVDPSALVRRALLRMG